MKQREGERKRGAERERERDRQSEREKEQVRPLEARKVGISNVGSLTLKL